MLIENVWPLGESLAASKGRPLAIIWWKYCSKACQEGIQGNWEWWHCDPRLFSWGEKFPFLMWYASQDLVEIKIHRYAQQCMLKPKHGIISQQLHCDPTVVPKMYFEIFHLEISYILHEPQYQGVWGLLPLGKWSVVPTLPYYWTARLYSLLYPHGLLLSGSSHAHLGSSSRPVAKNRKCVRRITQVISVHFFTGTKWSWHQPAPLSFEST